MQPLDGGPLVDAGLLSCLVTVLYRFLSPANPPDATSEPPPGNKTARKSRGNNPEGLEGLAKRVDDRRKRLSVEGSIVHIMKALAQHPSAAQSLVEDHSLQLLFCIVAIDMGATADAAAEEVGSPTKGERIKPQLHKAQLRRHAMQVSRLASKFPFHFSASKYPFHFSRVQDFLRVRLAVQACEILDA